MTKQQAANFTKCARNGITVYLKAAGAGTYKKPPQAYIVANRDGVEQVGKQLYEQNSEATTNKINDLLAHLASKI